MDALLLEASMDGSPASGRPPLQRHHRHRRPNRNPPRRRRVRPRRLHGRQPVRTPALGLRDHRGPRRRWRRVRRPAVAPGHDGPDSAATTGSPPGSTSSSDEMARATAPDEIVDIPDAGLHRGGDSGSTPPWAHPPADPAAAARAPPASASAPRGRRSIPTPASRQAVPTDRDAPALEPVPHETPENAASDLERPRSFSAAHG